MASEVVVLNIRESVPTQRQARALELRELAHDGRAVGLSELLRKSGLELDNVYANGRCWSDLRAEPEIS